MRLKHIYITKEGEPMGNPEMPMPLHFKEEFDYNQDDIDDYADAMKKYHSGLLPFEDREKIKEILRVEKIMDAFENGKLQKLIDGKFDKIKPDTLIRVDLESFGVALLEWNEKERWEHDQRSAHSHTDTEAIRLFLSSPEFDKWKQQTKTGD